MLIPATIHPPRWLLPLIVMVTVWSAAAHAQPEQPVGQIQLLRGVMKVRHQEVEKIYREAGIRVPVFQGNLVQTGRETRAKVEFLENENEVMEIFSRSQITIKQVSPEGSFLGLNIGKAIFGIFASARRKIFNVETPSATIGIKGTEFVVGSTGKDTFLLTTEGTVSIVNKQFPNIEVLVVKDQITKTTPNEPPTAPIKVTPEVSATIVKEDGLQTFESIALPPAVEQSTEEEQSEEEEQAAEEEQSEEEQAAEEEQSEEEQSEEEQVAEESTSEEQASEEEQVASDDSGSEEDAPVDDSGGGSDGTATGDDTTTAQVLEALDTLSEAQATIEAASATAPVLRGLQIKIVR